MGKSPSLNPLGSIKTTKHEKSLEGLEEGEDDQEQPLSPMSRLFHEPGPNVYIITLFGMKTLIDVDLFKARLVPILEKNHRFSSVQVVEKETGSMTWVPGKLNIDNHVIIQELDPNMESSDKFVADYISNLSRTRIDSSKPLWDLHILNTKTSDAQGTCVFRFHHSLGDGMSLMNLLLTCSRKASDPEAMPTLPQKKYHTRNDSIRSLLLFFWNTLVSIVLFVLTPYLLKDTKTPLKGSPGVEDRPRTYVLTSLSLNEIKMVKNAMDVTVNDVLLGVIQGGFYRYLNRRYGMHNKSVPKNIRLRAMIPFNLRATTQVDVFADRHGTWGNKIGCVLLPVNIRHRKDPLDHIREVKAIMDRKKASLEPFLTPFFTNLLIKLFGVKSAMKVIRKFDTSTTFWISNVPGPQQEILFCGHEVAYFAPSCYGQPTALLIHVVSYVDKVTFMISVDEETIPDPRTLCDDLQESFNLIKTAVLATKCIKN